MTLRVAADIWNLVRDALPEDDIQQLADDMVGILIDNDYDLDDIRHEFTGEAEVLKSVKYYAEEYEMGEWTDEEFESEETDDWGDEPEEY